MPSGLALGERSGEYVWAKDGSVMVFIPPGPFPMGSARGASDERPVHEVHLDGYYIDKYEVTWGRWKLSGLPYDEEPNDFRLLRPQGPDWGILDDHPVNFVNWDEAKAYTEWAGKRLPTEAEWEKAARGADGREYPWGDAEPTFEKAVWREHPVSSESTSPVDCCPEGASPYGVFNLAGNVYEWCEDVYAKDFYGRSPSRNPVNETPGKYRVLRGGGFPLEREYLRSAFRYRLLPTDRTPYIGFRTAVSAPRAGSGGRRR